MSKIWQALKHAERLRGPMRESPPVGDGLSKSQQAAIQALIAHGSVSAAASECGISARSIESWLKTPHFVAVYHAASRAARWRR